ncbi:transposase [Gracilinema caldarium]|uniref:transposase n=1 Tax=Gracilinema caldarium TaxID=215591 RepID=UPI0026EE8F4E|nr:transposase [Gracilinema caldarium]
MQQVVSDHHRFDLLVTKDSRIFRPWITAWQDYRSGKILGWAPSVYPSSLTILQAFYMMVMRYGLPEMCHMDNGKDYRSKVLMGANLKVTTINAQGVSDEDLLHLQGTFQMLGVQTTYARAYYGQSKGRLERTFGTFAEYIAKDSGYYIGSNTVSRPEDVTLYYRAINKKAKKQVLLSWEEFCHKLDAFIDFWNANWHGEGKGMNGLTPDEVFARYAPEPRKADMQTLALALTRPEIRKVTRNGVSVMGVQYWAPELLEYASQEVVVRIPIVKPETALIQTIQGQTICTAWADYFMATGDVAGDNEKVNAARKSNLELVRHRSERLKQTKGLKTFLDLPAKPKQELPDLSALPLAAGAEPVRQREQKPLLKSPLDI